MSDQTCSSCGAGLSPNHLTCQSCGAVHVELDPKQELSAIQEIAATARRIGGESENFLEAMMAQTGAVEGQSKHERIAQLWTNAFIPMTFEAQFQALNQCVGAIKTSGRSDHAGKIMANEALVKRAEMLLASMEAHAGSDPSLRPRAAAAKTLFQQTRDKSQALEQAGKRKAYIIIGASVAMVLFLIFGASSILGNLPTPVQPEAAAPAVDTIPIPSQLRGDWYHKDFLTKDGCDAINKKVIITSNSVDWAYRCGFSARETISGIKGTDQDGVFTVAEGSYYGGDCQGTTLEMAGGNLVLAFKCANTGGQKINYGSWRERIVTFTRQEPPPVVAVPDNADEVGMKRAVFAPEEPATLPAKLHGTYVYQGKKSDDCYGAKMTLSADRLSVIGGNRMQCNTFAKIVDLKNNDPHFDIKKYVEPAPANSPVAVKEEDPDFRMVASDGTLQFDGYGAPIGWRKGKWSAKK